MDTLAKETMGLPIFICATNQQIISSGTSTHSSSTSVTNPPFVSSTTPSPTTTSFFATSTPTRSPTSSTFSPTFSSFPAVSTATNNSAERHQRRNTYTPPTFSVSTRRESLLSTHRLSQVFDYASTYAVGVLTKAADSVFGEQGQGVEEGIWGVEDLEAGERVREGQGQREGDVGRRDREDKGKYTRFGDEGGFEGWLD
jgi:hypothetical protein